MVDKIDSFSPKKEIIYNFYSLINRIDIVYEETLKKYQEEQILSQSVALFRDWKKKYKKPRKILSCKFRLK